MMIRPRAVMPLEPQLKAIIRTLLLVYLPLGLAAQTDKIIPLSSEPHHHLALHNEYLNVYRVEVGAHDSVLLHRHDFDAISIMLNDAEVTVYTPGKPEVHRKLTAGQVRLQARGYIHSTKIDGDSTYRNITVELLTPQSEQHNLCFPVIPDKPLRCPDPKSSKSGKQIQFESNESSVSIVTLPPHQKSSIARSASSQLVIALDDGSAWHDHETHPKRTLHSGDFLWMDAGKGPASLRNSGERDVHIAIFAIKPSPHSENVVPVGVDHPTSKHN